MLRRTVLFMMLVSSTLATSLAVAPSMAWAADSPVKDAIQKGACDASGQTSSECNSAKATTSINKTIGQVINILSVLVGIVAVIMIVYGGFRYITSGGAAEKVKSAKEIVLYAIIGLIIVALAQVIAKFVLNKTTS